MLIPGISAILVKELRGRMRGRRTFVILTIYLMLLAGLAWMLQQLTQNSIAMNQPCFDSRFGGTCGGTSALYLSPTIGRSIFVGLTLLLTLVVMVLSPAFTASAISGEREHQTLDLLAATPISSLAIVLGKLVSSLTWIFLLIVASIPVMALVFVFGGVGPEDLIRAYVVLFATAIGLGSVGLFFSALVRRSVAATGLTSVATLVFLIGTFVVWTFLAATAGADPSTGIQKRPSEAILYLNSFIAEADVACDASGGSDSLCSLMYSVLGYQDVNGLPGPVDKPGVGVIGGGGVLGSGGKGGFANANGGVTTGPNGATAPADATLATTTATRDRFWPKTVVSYLLLALVLTATAVQSVTPTRRWRPGIPARLRARPRRTPA